MTERDFSRRQVLQTTAYAGAGAIALFGCTTGRSGSSQGGTNGLNAALPPIEGSQVVLDPAQFPKTLTESPEFAKKVAAGQLPPVAERVGQDPLVIKPLHGTGKYGGEIRRGFLASDLTNGAGFCGGPDSLLYWDYTGKKLIPNIAKGFALSDGDRVLTLHLRRGMMWSDGKPFTADDVIFWREDVNLHPDLGGAGTLALRSGDKNVEVKKVDDYTVQFISAAPNSILPEQLASNDDVGGLAHGALLLGGGFAPKHYLSRFHPKYTSESKANKAAKAAGFNDWVAYFRERIDWSLNTELPMLTPWITTRPMSKPPWELAANPYAIWVDNEGNQLPYIPKVTMSLTENPDVLNLRTVAGQYDFQDRNLVINSLPVLVKNQKRSNYTIHRAPSSTMEFGVRFNLAYNKDETIGELIRNVDFRRALSLGIDRNQLNQTFALGLSKPSATMAADDSKYFPGPEWRTKWATLDVAQANALLDKAGLTKKDSAGYRLRPDGKGRLRLDYLGIVVFADFLSMGEMVKRQWQKIGIELNVQRVGGALLVQRALSGDLQMTGHLVGTEDPFLLPDFILPTSAVGITGVMGAPYAKWFQSGGEKGEEPPTSLALLKQAMNLYQQGRQSPEAQRVNLGKEIYKLHADQVWSIGVFGFGLMLFALCASSNKLENVPDRIVNSLVERTPNNLLPMTFYYK
ncbi:MAG TPA: ABC transporter substrate-binding protein [Streptosporangiaceae bacterium]|jgi:peptide/nickel transport system substrate-binding protein